MYQNNKITSMVTFHEGTFTGPFTIYDASGFESTPLLSGNLKNGKFHGSETQFAATFRLHYEYTEGTLNELLVQQYEADTSYNGAPFQTRSPQTNRTITTKLTSLYKERYSSDSSIQVENYWENSAVHWRGYLINESISGTLQEFDNEGNLLLEGIYIHQQAPRKWKVRKVKRNGKVVYRNKKMEVATPQLRPVLPEVKQLIDGIALPNRDDLLF